MGARGERVGGLSNKELTMNHHRGVLGSRHSVRLGFDATSLMVNGKRTFLVSGEFHYFRVPQAEWKRRLALLKAAGGNSVATYVPWCIHEEAEGDIRFGDRSERDLDAFLRAVEEAGLLAIVRPGPYQYSELVYDGLPKWLIEKHPEILMKRADGSAVGPSSVDYNHPVFLAKVRPYFRAFAQVVRPHLAANGGCVALVQLDNELTGIHVWFGYSPTAGYFEDCAKYLETLKRYLAEDGLAGPCCHNAGMASMCASYAPSARRLGTRDFLLGYDHYYGLSPDNQESPAPYYFFDALFACDVLRGFGYPPVGFEIQCGTIGDIPPIFREDALACFMLNLAAGARGINYYVFTGGPNYPGSGNTMDVYDYHAPIAADGTVRPTYAALKEFGEFVAAHPGLLETQRLASVRLGAGWQHFANLAPFDRGFNRLGMFYTLMLTPYHPEHYLIDGEIPLDGKPLVLAGISSMSAAAQQRVADFVSRGGSLLVAPDFPRIDLDGTPCTRLAEAVQAPKSGPAKVNAAANPCVEIRGLRVYGLDRKLKLDSTPEGVWDLSWPCGKGRVTQLALTWKARYFLQADMIASLAGELGAQPVLSSSNRNVFTTAYRLKDGKTGVFALNLRPAPQDTLVSLPGGAPVKVELPAMNVQYREISLQ